MGGTSVHSCKEICTVNRSESIVGFMPKALCVATVGGLANPSQTTHLGLDQKISQEVIHKSNARKDTKLSSISQLRVDTPAMPSTMATSMTASVTLVERTHYAFSAHDTKHWDFPASEFDSPICEPEGSSFQKELFRGISDNSEAFASLPFLSDESVAGSTKAHKHTRTVSFSDEVIVHEVPRKPRSLFYSEMDFARFKLRRWLRVYETLDPRYPHWEELIREGDVAAPDVDKYFDDFIDSVE